MHNVLIYADSLTWGIIPNTRKRLAFDERWPGVLENRLRDAGLRARVIEDCLNGRRTVWDDPFKPGRNGLAGLAQRIETHSPLSLVITHARHKRFSVLSSVQQRLVGGSGHCRSCE
jgi:lysophospholipase L1-like esterase